tara:strand:- start:1132 stop:2331 length:1200 start_codon:yes stop_codon:yes gene_type:complete
MRKSYGLPENVVFCKSCVISNQRPNSSIEFLSKSRDKKSGILISDDGICSACKYSNIKDNEIDWDFREQELLKLLDKYRSNDGNYDVIVPGSGGKDSAFTSHLLKYKYGMNPLTVTWAPHLYTNIGFENFTNWIHVGGFDNILYTPNGRLHRFLTSLAFKNLLHPFQPFIVGQRIIGPRIAQKFGIKLIMYGENQAEYGNNIVENQNPEMSNSFYSVESTKKIVLGGLEINEIIKKTDFKLGDFKPYVPLTKVETVKSNLNYQYLGYYIKWDPQECYYYSTKNTGFKPNTERTEGSYSKYSSIDDKIDPFHYYTTLIKFGLGRTSYDASQEIRNHKITRDEGVALVKKYDQEFPKIFFKEFIDYISVSEEEFFNIIDSFRPEHLWSKKKNDWELKHVVQ